MENLVHVPKITAGERKRGQKMGRPARVVFALRNYFMKSCMLAIPSDLVKPGDGAEFFMSEGGFAVQLSPAGSRKLSTRSTSVCANVPLEVRQRLAQAPAGSTDLLIVQALDDRTWFFPFSQLFQPAAA